MKKNALIGKKGEEFAKEFLIAKEYTILHTNWRHKKSEVDIIAQHKNVIVFVEVKTRNNIDFGNPESFVDNNKIKKLREAADAFIEKYNWQDELRFDIISIEKENKIIHFEDAFY